jgi:sugar lactone lactonase YvrE
MMPIGGRQLGVWCVAVLAACSGERTASDAWRAKRDTVGDTMVVRTVSGSVWGSPRTLVAMATVGKADGADHDLLGDFRAIAVGPDGSIYISDEGPVLHKYAPDGHYVATLGRKGGGPGEYANPDGGLAVLSDGRVLIRDPGNGRITVYDTAGNYLAGWRINAGSWYSRQFAVDTADNVYIPVTADPDSAYDKRRGGLERFAPDGTPGDTLIAPQWQIKPSLVTGQKEGNSSAYSVPFARGASWDMSPLGYFVGGASHIYRITLFRTGAPLVIERDIAPVAVQSQEAADKKQEITDQMRRNFGDWSWNGPDIPATKPPFTDIAVGDDGRVWVLLSQGGRREQNTDPSKPATWSEPVVYDVFEPDGRYLGQVTTPDGFKQYPEPVFRGDTVWAGFENADGVVYVKRYELSGLRPR